VAGYGLGDQGSGNQRILPLPPVPSQLWGLPSLLSSGYGGFFPRGLKCGQGVMMTTCPLLVPRLRKRGYTSSPHKCLSWCVSGKLYFTVRGYSGLGLWGCDADYMVSQHRRPQPYLSICLYVITGLSAAKYKNTGWYLQTVLASGSDSADMSECCL
jgi:hypothetical protein